MSRRIDILRDRLTAARGALDAAKAAAAAQHVPDEDITSHTPYPVQGDGWYPITTHSERPAWQRYWWTSSGQLECGPATYSRDTEDAVFPVLVRVADAQRYLDEEMLHARASR